MQKLFNSNPLVFTILKQKVAQLGFFFNLIPKISAFYHNQEARRSCISCPLFYPDLCPSASSFSLLKLTVHSHLDLHYAFLPKFTRHIDNRTCTDSLSPPPPLSLPFFEVLEMSSPLLSPCLFYLLPSDPSLPLFIPLKE